MDADSADFARHVRRTVYITFPLIWFMAFGALVLADGDWIPGGIIVAAALVGFSSQVPMIWKLCRQGPRSSPPRGKPAE